MVLYYEDILNIYNTRIKYTGLHEFYCKYPVSNQIHPNLKRVSMNSTVNEYKYSNHATSNEFNDCLNHKALHLTCI